VDCLLLLQACPLLLLLLLLLLALMGHLSVGVLVLLLLHPLLQCVP